MMGRRSFMGALAAVTGAGVAPMVAQAAVQAAPGSAAQLPLMVLADPVQGVAHGWTQRYAMLAREAILSQPTQIQKLMQQSGRMAGVGPATDVFVAAALLPGSLYELQVLGVDGRMHSMPLGSQSLVDSAAWLGLSPEQWAQPAIAEQVLAALGGQQQEAVALRAEGDYLAWTLTAR